MRPTTTIEWILYALEGALSDAMSDAERSDLKGAIQFWGKAMADAGELRKRVTRFINTGEAKP